MAACTCPKYVPRIIEVLSVDGSSGQQIGSSTFDPSTAEKSWVSPTERYAVVPDENENVQKDVRTLSLELHCPVLWADRVKVPRQAVIPVRGSGNDKSSKSLWNFWLGKIKRLEGLLDFLGNSAGSKAKGPPRG
ncbi:Ultraviolet-B receptor UVR8 [Capsicum chinense]|nr:Ultraviolet-B receptor UVR8 [Capsicum chinense]